MAFAQPRCRFNSVLVGMTIDLPYPPSINHYWRRAGRIIHISSEGQEYRRRVCTACRLADLQQIPGRLRVWVKAHPPDKRRRDLDNLLKPLLDALQHGGAYADDGQIDWLLVERAERIEGGKVLVRIGALPPCSETIAARTAGAPPAIATEIEWAV